MMSRDMSGRFAPIYSSLIVKPGKPGPGGIDVYAFIEKSGYLTRCWRWPSGRARIRSWRAA